MCLKKLLISVVVINSNMSLTGNSLVGCDYCSLFFLNNYSNFKNLRHGSGSLSSFSNALRYGMIDFPSAVFLRFFQNVSSC